MSVCQLLEQKNLWGSTRNDASPSVCTPTNTHTHTPFYDRKLILHQENSFILLISAFVFYSVSKSVRGAENWTGESLSDKVVLLRLRLNHMTFSTKYFRSFVVRPAFSCKRTSPIISVWTDVLTARSLQVWRRLYPLQPFQVLHDKGGGQGPHRPNCPSIINARQLVRAMSSEHTEEERKVLCESLNSSASNSQYSLTGLTSCSSPTSPPLANPAAPPQPPWRVRATSHLHPYF